MNSNEKMGMAFRHLKDSDRLETHGLNGPIEAGQEQIAKDIAENILSLARSKNFKSINILYSDQRRTQETTELVRKELEKHIEVSLRPEEGLREIDQGIPNLPAGYKDGDFLPTLPAAWDAFGEEAFSKRNFSYRFGSAEGSSVHTELVGAFDKHGDSLADYIVRQYAFLEKLFSGELQDGNAMSVLCTHSTTLFILQELDEIAKDIRSGVLGNIAPEDLPIVCFEYYQKKIEPVLPTGLPFGHVATFDITSIQNSPLVQTIRDARKYFLELKNQQSV